MSDQGLDWSNCPLYCVFLISASRSLPIGPPLFPFATVFLSLIYNHSNTSNLASCSCLWKTCSYRTVSISNDLNVPSMFWIIWLILFLFGHLYVHLSFTSNYCEILPDRCPSVTFASPLSQSQASDCLQPFTIPNGAAFCAFSVLFCGPVSCAKVVYPKRNRAGYMRV